jgi:hypothetical protein
MQKGVMSNEEGETRPKVIEKTTCILSAAQDGCAIRLLQNRVLA